MRVTVAQLRINRKIALTAVARVARLEARLGMPPPVPAITSAPAPIRRLRVPEMKLTQRIAQSALRRATAVRIRVEPGSAAPSPAAGPGGGRVALTARQLRINQRIAQAALRRVAEAEAVAEGSGLAAPA